jgi:hypothetical protein
MGPQHRQYLHRLQQIRLALGIFPQQNRLRPRELNGLLGIVAEVLEMEVFEVHAGLIIPAKPSLGKALGLRLYLQTFTLHPGTQTSVSRRMLLQIALA